MDLDGGNNTEFIMKHDERIDDLIRGGLKIIQSPSAFCFSMDAVLLSNFATVKKGDRVLDLGTGTGVIPMLLSTRANIEHAIGLEIQPDSVDRACRSIKGNNLGHLIEIVEGNIVQADKLFGIGKFDLVVSNPPYLKVGRGERNQLGSIAIAKHEVLCSLEDIVRVSSRLVKYGGRVAVVHRPDRLSDIITLFAKYQLKARRLQLVYPKPDQKPNILLIEAQLGGNPELIIMEPFFVYDEQGNYTQHFWNTYYPGLPYGITGGDNYRK